MDNKEMLKEMLSSGITPDELTSLLNDAQKEIEKEAEEAKAAEKEKAAKEAAIDEARSDLEDAIDWYIISLGIAPDEDDDESWDFLDSAIHESIKKVENSLLNTKVTIKTGKAAEDSIKKYDDEIRKLDDTYKRLFRHWF